MEGFVTARVLGPATSPHRRAAALHNRPYLPFCRDVASADLLCHWVTTIGKSLVPAGGLRDSRYYL